MPHDLEYMDKINRKMTELALITTDPEVMEIVIQICELYRRQLKEHNEQFIQKIKTLQMCVANASNRFNCLD